MHVFRKIMPLLGLLLGLGLALETRAEPVRVQLASGLAVNAEFRAGAADKPAVLVLHGFLQTYDFMATMNIVNGLSALDFTVLAPNLSLGVPDRRQSMQCNAAHAHTFDGDLAEIDFWIQWLNKQGHRSVILVGHSWGSQHSLGYSVTRPDAPIVAVIAISLVRSHQSDVLLAQQGEKARERLARDNKSLKAYGLSFCKEYMATPASYLSYANWDDRHVLEVLSRLQTRDVPVHIILGEKDRRIDEAWIDALQPRVRGLSVIDGANHFFSHVSEFDLNERLEQIMPGLSE